jgi:hypothetical protein
MLVQSGPHTGPMPHSVPTSAPGDVFDVALNDCFTLVTERPRSIRRLHNGFVPEPSTLSDQLNSRAFNAAKERNATMDKVVPFKTMEALEEADSLTRFDFYGEMLDAALLRLCPGLRLPGMRRREVADESPPEPVSRLPSNVIQLVPKSQV